MKDPKIKPIELDVTDGPAVRRAIEEAGELDALFKCAGWVHNGTILDCTEEDWARSFDQNVTSMFHTIRAALPNMIARGRGSIINVASVASSITGVPKYADGRILSSCLAARRCGPRCGSAQQANELTSLQTMK